MDTGEAERRIVVELVVGEPASGQEPLELPLRQPRAGRAVTGVRTARPSAPPSTAPRTRAGSARRDSTRRSFRPELEARLAIGFVGTYPPTKCGIATFTMSLARALAREPSCRRAGIVACVDEPGERHPPEVVAELVSGSPDSIDAAAAELRRFDVVVVQHEFGIYGGKDGGEIVDLVRRLDVPSIVVLHTVPVCPSPNERAILEQLACLSGCLVAQSAAAWSRLVAGYDVRRDRVHVIPHGAVVNLGLAGRPRATGHRPVILTWGLLGPGKGIEYGIQAVAQLRDLDPKPRYVVLGETHPRVIAAQGETYRMALRELARSLAVEDLVELRDVYLKPKVLLAAIRMADVVLLPYLDRDQIVSGVLAEAIASGKPVVATGFPHAVELLRGGAGVVVPHEDPGAIAAALRSLLTDDDRALRAAAAARQQAEKLSWEKVAGAYVRLISAQPARSVAVHR